MSEESTRPPLTFYEAVGGEETFTRLVHRFYEEVAADPVLRAVYPAQDLGPAEEHLRLFLIQYWGGPPTYNELRGHPRLRMRHVRFHIGETERDLWLTHMRTALDSVELDPALDAQLWDYLVMAAHSLVNVVPENTPGPSGRGDLGITPTYPFGLFGAFPVRLQVFRSSGPAEVRGRGHAGLPAEGGGERARRLVPHPG